MFIYVVGLQVYHVHKSYDHATLYVGGVAFLVKMIILTPVTPNDPKSKFESISFVKGLKLVYMHK